jgi:hypothetical protein
MGLWGTSSLLNSHAGSIASDPDPIRELTSVSLIHSIKKLLVHSQIFVYISRSTNYKIMLSQHCQE